jgi:hypothetical protein
MKRAVRPEGETLWFSASLLNEAHRQTDFELLAVGIEMKTLQQ